MMTFLESVKRIERVETILLAFIVALCLSFIKEEKGNGEMKRGRVGRNYGRFQFIRSKK